MKNPTLELKIKKGDVGGKESYKVEDLNGFSCDDCRIKNEIVKTLPVNVAEEFVKTRPVLLNSYKRKYYESLDRNVRLTLDRSLVYKRPGSNDLYSVPGQILEIKCSPQFNMRTLDILNRIALRVTKFSKYANGMRILYGY